MQKNKMSMRGDYRRRCAAIMRIMEGWCQFVGGGGYPRSGMKHHGGKARDGFPAVFGTRASARRASGAAAAGCMCRQINSRRLMGIGASREFPDVFALSEMSRCIRHAAADQGGRMRGRGENTQIQ